MNRVPWAPLNASVFLIILGGLILASLLTGLTIFAVFPLIFTFFGAWMIVEAFVFPPANSYAPPRIMVVGWGALMTGFGVFLLVSYFADILLPVVFTVIFIVEGLAVIVFGYSKHRHSKSWQSSSIPVFYA